MQNILDPAQPLLINTRQLEFLPMAVELNEQILEIARGTGAFRDQEIKALEEVIDDYFDQFRELGHVCEVACLDGETVGFLYFAPNPMSEGAWQLWWIILRDDLRGKGLGARLLHRAEQQTRENQGRLMFIETSSQEKYGGTLKFYFKHGYEKEAQLRDFYHEGDDMVIFRKKL